MGYTGSGETLFLAELARSSPAAAIVVYGICANAMYLLGPVTEMYLNWLVDAWEGRLVPQWLAGFVRSRYTTGLLFAGGCLFSVLLTLAIGLSEVFAAALPDQP